MSLTLEFTTLVNWRRVPSLETCLIKSQRVNWNGHYLMKIMIGCQLELARKNGKNHVLEIYTFHLGKPISGTMRCQEEKVAIHGRSY